MNKAYIVDAIRTPVGKYGGALSSIRPDDLAAHVIRAILARNEAWLPLEEIEDVIFGAANQAGEDNPSRPEALPSIAFVLPACRPSWMPADR